MPKYKYSVDINDARIQTFNRWRNYTKVNPKKYRILMKVSSGKFYSCLQSYDWYNIFNPYPDSNVVIIGRLYKGWSIIKRLDPWDIKDIK